MADSEAYDSPDFPLFFDIKLFYILVKLSKNSKSFEMYGMF